MNKRKRVAILKHRRKAKKLEEKRRASLIGSGGVSRPAVKVAPKKEIAIPKPVKALADILKPKEAVVAKKPATKKAAPEKAEPVEKATKALVRKKKTEPVDETTSTAQADSSKKARAKKKKTESSEAG